MPGAGGGTSAGAVGRRLLPAPRDDAVHLGGREAHPEVDAERPGHQLLHVLADRAARRATHDLVQQGAVRDGVVGHRRPRGPQRPGRGQGGGDRRAAVQVQPAQAGAQRRVGQARGVRGHHGDGGVLLALDGVLGPVPAETGASGSSRPRSTSTARTVAVTPLLQDATTISPSRGIGRRAHDVGAAPEVDHLPAVVEHRDRGRVLAGVVGVRHEGVRDRAEPVLDPPPTVSLHRTNLSPAPGGRTRGPRSGGGAQAAADFRSLRISLFGV